MPSDHARLPDLPARLTRALDLSRQMLAAAQAGDWPRLSGLEVEREPLLDAASLTVSSLAPPLRGHVAALLSDCLRVNDQIAELTAGHLRRLRESVDALSGVDFPGGGGTGRP